MRIILAELKQETATFNPWLTRYDDFRICRGAEMLSAYAGTQTELAGAIDVFRAEQMELAPTLAAAAVSGGPIVQPDLDRLINELLALIRQERDADAAYLCLHGAMAGEADEDPEGRLLAAVREILGNKPLVASLDLHAVLTDKMLAAADVLAPFHTYPHVDQYQTGQRAARVLVRLLGGIVRPTTVRVSLPMLVRGDELLTATGKVGEATGRCAALEQEPDVLAAGVIIGNAFTDVPALQSHVLVTTNGNPARAQAEAEQIARFMWRHRKLFQAQLTPLDEALRLAEQTAGLTIFSDGADATASGAAGDSNAILRALLGSVGHGRHSVGNALRGVPDGTRSGPASISTGHTPEASFKNSWNATEGVPYSAINDTEGVPYSAINDTESVPYSAINAREGVPYSRPSLVPIVDAPAVARAFQTGVGQTCWLTLGGTRDPGRFEPLPVEAYVKSLHDGQFHYEDGTAARAGRAAVLVVGRVTVLATERPVYVVGRRVFQAHGLEPTDFGLVVVKSPNGYRTWYESLAAQMIPVDVPGSTSANLRSLPYRRCVRPIFPLDENVVPSFSTHESCDEHT